MNGLWTSNTKPHKPHKPPFTPCVEGDCPWEHSLPSGDNGGFHGPGKSTRFPEGGVQAASARAGATRGPDRRGALPRASAPKDGQVREVAEQVCSQYIERVRTRHGACTHCPIPAPRLTCRRRRPRSRCGPSRPRGGRTRTSRTARTASRGRARQARRCPCPSCPQGCARPSWAPQAGPSG